MVSKTPRTQLGRYRLLKKLGIGGMGTVYLAEDAQAGRQIALKMPRFEAKEGSPILERFEREARIAAGIDHPHLCPVYDYGQVDGTPYLTMPYIEGTPLSRMLALKGFWDQGKALALVRTLAEALQVVHDQGIVHRDLKPSNIMIRPNEQPIIMDFGLARSYTEATKQLTATGIALGTPAYMAPEQILEAGNIGPGTDIYSLGVILYELLTGELPFEGTPTALFGQILHATPPPPSQHRPDIEENVEAVCLRALAKKQADRFGSMTEFAQALDAAMPKPPPELEHPPASRPMPVVRVNCPECGKRLKVPPEAEGHPLYCPKCNAPIESPEEQSWLQRPLFKVSAIVAVLLLLGMAGALVLKAQLVFIACWVGLLLLGGLVIALARRGGEEELEGDTPEDLASIRLEEPPHITPPQPEIPSDGIAKSTSKDKATS